MIALEFPRDSRWLLLSQWPHRRFVDRPSPVKNLLLRGCAT
jgi:hypothetical protein